MWCNDYKYIRIVTELTCNIKHYKIRNLLRRLLNRLSMHMHEEKINKGCLSHSGLGYLSQADKILAKW